MLGNPLGEGDIDWFSIGVAAEHNVEGQHTIQYVFQQQHKTEIIVGWSCPLMEIPPLIMEATSILASTSATDKISAQNRLLRPHILHIFSITRVKWLYLVLV